MLSDADKQLLTECELVGSQGLASHPDRFLHKPSLIIPVMVTQISRLYPQHGGATRYVHLGPHWGLSQTTAAEGIQLCHLEDRCMGPLIYSSKGRVSIYCEQCGLDNATSNEWPSENAADAAIKCWFISSREGSSGNTTKGLFVSLSKQRVASCLDTLIGEEGQSRIYLALVRNDASANFAFQAALGLLRQIKLTTQKSAQQVSQDLGF